MRKPYAGRMATLLIGLFAATSALSQSRLPTVERFTATTASMTPSGVGLRIDVREWSDEEGRAAVVEALQLESGVSKALTELPTLGYVWLGDSAVGYSVKYAHKTETPDGERVTFVTNKRIGSYESKPWTANAASSGAELDYSVVELYLGSDKTGVGTLSIAADVEIDSEHSLVSLAADPSAPKVLAEAKHEPPPYWAKGSDGMEEG
ncbi:MAG TPA: hypothetical protein VF322_11090 [Gammaproteobacteria bacterium]